MSGLEHRLNWPIQRAHEKRRGIAEWLGNLILAWRPAAGLPFGVVTLDLRFRQVQSKERDED